MSSDTPVYLDHAATTPVDPAVARAMLAVLGDPRLVGNPSSTDHAPGRTAATAVADARARVAAVVGARPQELVWTSGATEADNLAVLGIARGSRWRGRHVISARTEHRAVLDACAALEREGFELTYLEPDAEGSVAPDALAAALREDTVLVSLMHVNNETGSVNDIAALGALCRAAGVPFHVDAAQSVGKFALDLAALPVDLMSLNAHKAHGPRGIGALYVASAVRARVQPLLHGGGQEGGLRPGTLATHQIVGMAEALERAEAVRERERERVGDLRRQLWQGLSALGGVQANSPLERGSPWILNVAFEGVDGESLRLALTPVAVSGGSACNSLRGEVSYVLKALKLDDVLAHGSVRFSFGRTTTRADIDAAVAVARAAVPALRDLAPTGGDGRTAARAAPAALD